MGLTTFLLRLGLYGSIATAAMYYPIYNRGFDTGQLNGYKVGYQVCEQKKNSEMDTIVQKSVDGFNGIRDSAKYKIDEIVAEKERLKASGLEGLTDTQIKKILDSRKEKGKESQTLEKEISATR
jgi:hypothetical protein